MKCSKLIELSNLIDLNDLQTISALYVYMYEKCLGRVSLSKKLEVRERVARRIINYLKNKNLITSNENTCICNEAINNYTLYIETLEINKYTVSIIKIDDYKLLDYIDRHIVNFRDYIVVKTQNPYSIEIIGYYNGVEYVIPGLPIYLQTNYIELLEKIKMIKNTLFIIWKKYSRYYCEASIISSLYNTCLEIRKTISSPQ